MREPFVQGVALSPIIHQRDTAANSSTRMMLLYVKARWIALRSPRTLAAIAVRFSSRAASLSFSRS
ncbi:hypothetical protein D3C87_1903240 [compost metagenome]